MLFNPLRILAVLLDPQIWLMLSADLAKASPILIPIYYSTLSWINTHLPVTHPQAGTLHSRLALCLTLEAFFFYQIVKPGKAS